VRIMCRFTDLLPHLLLTMSLSTPINWMVASTHSPYDLDNIRLNDVEQGLGRAATCAHMCYFVLLWTAMLSSTLAHEQKKLRRLAVAAAHL